LSSAGVMRRSLQWGNLRNPRLMFAPHQFLERKSNLFDSILRTKKFCIEE